MTSEIDKLKHFYVNMLKINILRLVLIVYLITIFVMGLLCNIVVLKVIKDEEK